MKIAWAFAALLCVGTSAQTWAATISRAELDAAFSDLAVKAGAAVDQAAALQSQLTAAEAEISILKQQATDETAKIAALEAEAAVLRDRIAELEAGAPPPPPPDPVPPPAPVGQACVTGTPVAKPAAVILPPGVPQPNAARDLVGVIVQGNSAAADASATYTFGQVFVAGKVKPDEALVAVVGGKAYPAQMDALALHPDGSVRHAAITLAAGPCKGQQFSAMLAKAGNAPAGTPVDLAALPTQLTVDLAFTAGGQSQKIDLGAALKKTLADKPDFWLRGQLATQARVEVPVPGTPTLRLTADVTGYADGGLLADVQFNNDLATVSKTYTPPLPPLAYTATVALNGATRTHIIKQQVQYQDWHTVIDTRPGTPPHVQADIRNLIRAGAILPYDLKTGVNDSWIEAQVKTPGAGYSMPFGTLQNPAFGEPLSGNSISQRMPETGGRADIGPLTRWNTAWLVTQDERIARVAIQQGDTGGAVTWNYRLANGRWLTPADYPKIWADARTDSGLGLANYRNPVSGWVPDAAHQPELNYLPYLMTARRWHLDRLNAQAAANLSSSWYAYRCFIATCDLLMDFNSQVRAEAWGMREIMLAAWIGRSGSWERDYFAEVVGRNWTYALNQTKGPAGKISVEYEGEAAGYVPYFAYTLASGDKGSAPWQDDYVTLVAAWGGIMGFDGAKGWVDWQRGRWLTGRVLGEGVDPLVSCIGTLVTYDGATKAPIKTWAGIAAAMKKAGTGYINTTGMLFSDYCNWYRGALNASRALFPDDQRLADAVAWIETHADPKNAVNSTASFRNDPTYNIVPPTVSP